jgi:twitching motility protein PilT
MYEINEIIKEAVDSGASDIFLTVGVPPIMKIGNKMHSLGENKLAVDDTRALISSMFTSDEKYSSFLQHKSIDFSYSLKSIGRFRVSAFFQRGSMAATIRVVRFVLPNSEELHIPQSVLDVYKLRSGLVLVTGPSGSGKSTTLASIINLINEDRQAHILTIEDPIEFLHNHKKSIVNQREINMDCSSYADALRVSMRQAPDVILIGEMRDLDTISAAITAAETGHFVISTLHTLGAANSIDRMVDVFPTGQQQQIKVQLSSVLKVVVSQQLVTTVDGSLYPAFEIMKVNNAIRNLIRSGNTHQLDMMIQSCQCEGMQTMNACLENMYTNGLISKSSMIAANFNNELAEKYPI